jgi:hypothetical protein
VRLLGPLELPHGAVLSFCASQTRSAGQRKATGPILVPSSPSPWVCAWPMDMAAAKREVDPNRMITGLTMTKLRLQLGLSSVQALQSWGSMWDEGKCKWSSSFSPHV